MDLTSLVYFNYTSFAYGVGAALVTMSLHQEYKRHQTGKTSAAPFWDIPQFLAYPIWKRVCYVLSCVLFWPVWGCFGGVALGHIDGRSPSILRANWLLMYIYPDQVGPDIAPVQASLPNGILQRRYRATGILRSAGVPTLIWLQGALR